MVVYVKQQACKKLLLRARASVDGPRRFMAKTACTPPPLTGHSGPHHTRNNSLSPAFFNPESAWAIFDGKIPAITHSTSSLASHPSICSSSKSSGNGGGSESASDTAESSMASQQRVSSVLGEGLRVYEKCGWHRANVKVFSRYNPLFL